MNLSTKLAEIKGVGPKTAGTFAAAGLVTAGDLLEFFPRRYADFSHASRIADLAPGNVTVRARIEAIATRFVRRGMQITTATLADDSGKLAATWFNQGFRAKNLEKFAGGAQEFLFTGEFRLARNRYVLSNPAVEKVDEKPGFFARNLTDKNDKIVPVYSARAGLKPAKIRAVLRELNPLIKMLAEDLPEEIVAREQLISRAAAVEQIHFPTDEKSLDRARKRLSFEELFELILAAKMNRNDNQKLRGFAFDFDAEKFRAVVENLPFALTNAQRKATWEIVKSVSANENSVQKTEKISNKNPQKIAQKLDKNLAQKSSKSDEKIAQKTQIPPMNRLLQGDVGSGKTVVAALIIWLAAQNNFQSALMAPTEILATQHAQTLSSLLGPFGVKIALLTGSVKGKNRENLLENLRAGKIDLLVGTHALFQPTVAFQNLGFVVIDEQHRFGVRQRQDLLAKTRDGFLPHLLAMTATPIPRSLQLTIFGDLDVSILDELPRGRKPITTEIISPVSRDKMDEKIRAEIAAGRQIYFVAPNILAGQSDKESVENLAKKVARKFGKIAIPGGNFAQIAELHGKMDGEAKEKIMRDFSANKTQILVSTTVVEVGVDVPNASVIVIENADSFGLAQLHQLRGRVGRGAAQSFCFLVQSDTNPPTRRLRELERSNDGFHLAEVDLELRGAGEIYGTMQHGALNLKIANLADTKMIARAANEAEKFAKKIAENPKILVEFPELERAILRSQRLTTLN